MTCTLFFVSRRLRRDVALLSELSADDTPPARFQLGELSDNHRKRRFQPVFTAAVVLGCLLPSALFAERSRNAPPNIVLFVADDQVFGDNWFSPLATIRIPCYEFLSSASSVVDLPAVTACLAFSTR